MTECLGQGVSPPSPCHRRYRGAKNETAPQVAPFYWGIKAGFVFFLGGGGGVKKTSPGDWVTTECLTWKHVVWLFLVGVMILFFFSGFLWVVHEMFRKYGKMCMWSWSFCSWVKSTQLTDVTLWGQAKFLARTTGMHKNVDSMAMATRSDNPPWNKQLAWYKGCGWKFLTFWPFYHSEITVKLPLGEYWLQLV